MKRPALVALAGLAVPEAALVAGQVTRAQLGLVALVERPAAVAPSYPGVRAARDPVLLVHPALVPLAREVLGTNLVEATRPLPVVVSRGSSGCTMPRGRSTRRHLMRYRTT